MDTQSSRKRLMWRFIFAVSIQVAIVLSIPVPKAITLARGSTIYLATRPIDPYDLLRGRYVTLDYEAENPAILETLPGYRSRPELEEFYGRIPPRIYLVMEPNEPEAAVAAWQPVRVAYSLPQDLGAGQHLLAGRLVNRWQNLEVDIGLGRYFIPEAIGDELEEDIRQHREATLAEVKVDRRGNAAIVGVWVEDRQY